MYLQNGKWDEGRKMLRSIEERLPYSPEFAKAKLLIADSFFYGSTSTYPEALVEYKSFLNYFPRSERRDYALFRIALCHYASIENAERDQAETRKAMEAFQDLLRDAPGSVYAVDARAKITQCWRRLAESELMVGIFYVNNFNYGPAERRLKELLDTYPDYVDRERAYYYLAEALRKKGPGTEPGEGLPEGVPGQGRQGRDERPDQGGAHPVQGGTGDSTTRRKPPGTAWKPAATTRNWWRAIPPVPGRCGPATGSWRWARPGSRKNWTADGLPVFYGSLTLAKGILIFS